MKSARLLISAVLMLCAQAAFAAEQTHWTRMAETIAAELAKVDALVAGGNAAEAKKAVTQVYFGLFESEKMEAAMRKELGSKPAYAREKQFGDLRKLAGSGDAAAVKALIADMRAGLLSDGKALDKAGIPPEVFAVNQ